MTVAETLAALKSEKDIEPSADYAGEENTDDFILAIQTDKTKQTKVSFAVSNSVCVGCCPAASRAAFSRSSFI